FNFAVERHVRKRTDSQFRGQHVRGTCRKHRKGYHVRPQSVDDLIHSAVASCGDDEIKFVIDNSVGDELRMSRALRFPNRHLAPGVKPMLNGLARGPIAPTTRHRIVDYKNASERSSTAHVIARSLASLSATIGHRNRASALR